MKFSYIAINSEYQKVTGVITEDTEQKAKEQLHKMGLSVLKISEDLSPGFKELDEKVKSFWFLVRDQKGKEASGTIEAEDRKNAFRRLVAEYKFEVLSLCEDAVPTEERLEVGKKDIAELEQTAYVEFGIEPLHWKQSSKNQENISNITDKRFLSQKKAILEEVDSVTKKTEDILQKYEHQISGQEYQDIKNTLDTLSRMKLSYNLTYIQSLSEQLFERIYQIIQKYKVVDIGEGISDQTDQVVETIHQSAQNKVEHNISTLHQLQNISQRLNVLSKRKRYFTEKEQELQQIQIQNSPKRSKAMRKLLWSLRQVFFTKSTAVRKEKWKELRQNWQEWKQQRQRQKILQAEQEIALGQLDEHTHTTDPIFTAILHEIRIFTGWLLGFYICFFFVAEYSILKGFSPLLPAINRLLETPFLLFFTTFLFFIALNLSIWHHFLRKKRFLFLLSSLCTMACFLVFVINF